VRDKSRSIEKTCIVVEDADLPKRCIGTCEGLRKELGLSVDVDDDDQLTVLRPSLYPSPTKDKVSSRPLRLDSLACDDLPLCDGEHL
ncbi:unnamed protein product, partial [Sphacelaria rigidula]